MVINIQKLKANKYLVFLVVFLKFSLSFSQTEVILSTPQTGQVENVATELVKFKTGYTFTATATDWMKGYIDEFAITKVDWYGSLITDQDIQEKSIQTSKMIGSIEGDFSVDMIGGASYSFGIDIPQGINGVTPSIGINYSSSGGNNLLGVGWSLAGISTISRVGQTHYLNGKVTSVKGGFS